MRSSVTIIGGGLAGTEAAWQVANRGFHVRLYEMRPHLQTGAHSTDRLAELVCSNSLGSSLPDRASGLLKKELICLGSIIIECAKNTALPAGGALAVGREAFADLVTERITHHPLIEVIRLEVETIPNGPVIVASGPLTSAALSNDIQRVVGSDHLYFYDALSPIVYADSIDMNVAYRGSRYERGTQREGDYINCPLTRREYYSFVRALVVAQRIELREFEQDIKTGVKAGPDKFFEGCLPIEVIAGRGEDSLAFGPMRPVGLRDPRSRNHAYAVVQLRQDDLAASLYNLVGFQTNLTWPEQRRVLAMIPGLAKARFARYGMMHRNTFVNAPTVLQPTMQSINRPDLFFAGQITGVEGYVGNSASGLVAGINLTRLLSGEDPVVFPSTTMIGALCRYVAGADAKSFQPMKPNFGILPSLAKPPGSGKWSKRERGAAYSLRATENLEVFLRSHRLL